MQTWYKLSKTKLFLIIVICNVSIAWLSRVVLVNDIVFYNTYSEQLTYERSMELLERMERFAWLGYLLIPVALFLKFTLVSIVVYTGVFFHNQDRAVSFSSVFKVVIVSEFVFILASVAKFLWFVFFAGNYDLNDISFFYPLSLINFFNISEVSRMWIYPLQTINLFQIIYIVALSLGLKNYSGISDSRSDTIVLTSYVPAVVVWMVLIMFISIDTNV